MLTWLTSLAWPGALILVVTLGMVVPDARAGGSGFKLQVVSHPPGGPIPAKHAMKAVRGGENRSIEVQWSGAPAGTQSFVLAYIDRHPIARGWVHWLVVNIPATASQLPEGASGSRMPLGALELPNSFGTPGYGGPQPPPGSGSHKYEASLYALSVPELANIVEKASWADVQKAMEGKILGQAAVFGTFER